MPLRNPTPRSASILPSDQGFLGWTADPAIITATSLMTSGRIVGARIYVPDAGTISTVTLFVVTAGATLTAGQSFVGLYTDAGALLTGSADQSTAFASTGTKTISLTTPQAVTAGWYRVVAYSVGTTPPTLRSSGSSTQGSVGLVTPRFFLADSGLTTALPASLGTQTATLSNWFGLS